jgi:putative oxidoreductase
MKRFFFDCGTRDSLASGGIFALRIMIGLMMLIGHGLPKIRNFNAILENGFPVPDFFPLKLMSPSISLLATIGAEVGAALLIILGLATRPAAFVLGFTMVVAAFSVMGNAPWFTGPGVAAAKEPAILFLIPMIAIIMTGAGSISIDAAIYKDGRRRRW